MALLSSIGDFLFLDLHGAVELLQEKTELLTRPGVDGTGLVQQGYRGTPFTVRSRVDQANLAEANDAVVGYLSYVGQGAFPLVQYACNFTAAYGVGFLVLAVKPVVLRSNLFLMGGLNPPSLAWLEADWTLCCVDLAAGGGDE